MKKLICILFILLSCFSFTMSEEELKDRDSIDFDEYCSVFFEWRGEYGESLYNKYNYIQTGQYCRYLKVNGIVCIDYSDPLYKIIEIKKEQAAYAAVKTYVTKIVFTNQKHNITIYLEDGSLIDITFYHYIDYEKNNIMIGGVNIPLQAEVDYGSYNYIRLKNINKDLGFRRSDYQNYSYESISSTFPSNKDDSYKAFF